MIRGQRNQHRRVGSDRRSPTTNGGDVNSSIEVTVNYTFNEIEAP